jgi:2-keto-3-deoxy-6-phosphogluconate aldolase
MVRRAIMAAIMIPITSRSIIARDTGRIIITTSRATAIARVIITTIPITARTNATGKSGIGDIMVGIGKLLIGAGRMTALPHSSSNSPANCSIIVPPNCSASMMVTALR